MGTLERRITARNAQHKKQEKRRKEDEARSEAQRRIAQREADDEQWAGYLALYREMIGKIVPLALEELKQRDYEDAQVRYFRTGFLRWNSVVCWQFAKSYGNKRYLLRYDGTIYIARRYTKRPLPSEVYAYRIALELLLHWSYSRAITAEVMREFQNDARMSAMMKDNFAARLAELA